MTDLAKGIYSQRDEQEVICKWFASMPEPAARKPRFLEVGAWTGKVFSNAHALALQGWAGVCIEPSPVPFVKLMKLYEERDDVKVVLAAVVSGEERLACLHATEDAVSSLDEKHAEQWAETASVPFQPIYVGCVTLFDVLRVFPGPFDFVSIDTEGGSWELLNSIAWFQFNASLICVEHDGHEPEAAQVAAEHGFEVVHVNSENVIFGKR